MAPIVLVDLENPHDQSLYNYLNSFTLSLREENRSQLTKIWCIYRELVKSFHHPDVSSVSGSRLLAGFISCLLKSP